MRLARILCLLLSALPLAALQAKSQKVDELYKLHCASCHGEDLAGGLGGSLVEGDWKHIGPGRSFADYVVNGNPEMGMPAFGDALDLKQLRALEIYITEKRHQAGRAQRLPPPPDGEVHQSGGHRFTLETLLDEDDGLDHPWALTFLPDGRGLFTERAGRLFLLTGKHERTEIKNLPGDIWQHGQGGLLEAAPHPGYARNGWIYLGYSASGKERDGKAQGMTKVVRGRIWNNRWIDNQILFEAPFSQHRSAGVHFGTRFVFQDGYLYFGIGDRGAQDQAQDPARPNGKIHRIHHDGRIPRDNPYAGQPGACHSIWTLGNRNPQGLVAHPATGEIWESEHGPRGGDEINRIQRGLNYGWPIVSYGMNYNGSPLTDRTEAPGYESPVLQWTPSIAVCGIEFHQGNQFPKWKHNLFAGGLKSEELHRLVIEDGQVLTDQIVLHDQGRVRDVANGPGGTLYLVLNGPHRIVRLMPVNQSEKNE